MEIMVQRQVCSSIFLYAYNAKEYLCCYFSEHFKLEKQFLSTVKNEGPEVQKPNFHVCPQLTTPPFTPLSQLARYQMPPSI